MKLSSVHCGTGTTDLLAAWLHFQLRKHPWVCVLAVALIFFHLMCRSDPDIIASWYTGRGIRPVGRFGRRETERKRGLAVPSHRVCAPAASSEDWVRDWPGRENCCYFQSAFWFSPHLPSIHCHFVCWYLMMNKVTLLIGKSTGLWSDFSRCYYSCWHGGLGTHFPLQSVNVFFYAQFTLNIWL